MSEPDAQYPQWVQSIVPGTVPAQIQLSGPVTALLALPLLLYVVLCFPPLCEFVILRLPVDFRTNLAQHKSSVVSWTEFVRLLGEVLTALFIGSQVFNDSMKRRVSEIASELQNAMDGQFKNASVETRDKIVVVSDVTWTALTKRVTLSNIVPNLFTLGFCYRRIVDLIHFDVPFLWSKLMFIRLSRVFPGGLYGLIAYFSFNLVLIMKCLKYYMDHLAAM